MDGESQQPQLLVDSAQPQQDQPKGQTTGTQGQQALLQALNLPTQDGNQFMEEEKPVREGDEHLFQEWREAYQGQPSKILDIYLNESSKDEIKNIRGDGKEEIMKEMGAKQSEEKKTSNQENKRMGFEPMLKQVYVYYCGIQVGEAGVTPTFDRIRYKTTTLTLNKFMIFAREFGLLQLPQITKQKLLLIFRKCSHYAKEITFNQFVDILAHASQLRRVEDSTQGQKLDASQQNVLFESLMRELKMQDEGAFEHKFKKVKKENKGRRNPLYKPQNPPPCSYKFKLYPQNGRNEEEVAQELAQRKMFSQIKKHENRKIRRFQSEMLEKGSWNQRTSSETAKKSEQVAEPPYKAPSRQLRDGMTSFSKVNERQSSLSRNKAGTGYMQIHKKKQMGGYGEELQLNHVIVAARDRMKTEGDYPVGSPNAHTPRSVKSKYLGLRHITAPSRDDTFYHYYGKNTKKTEIEEVKKQLAPLPSFRKQEVRRPPHMPAKELKQWQQLGLSSLLGDLDSDPFLEQQTPNNY